MAEAAPNYQQREDYWKPLPGAKLQISSPAEAVRSRCLQCQAELVPSAQFCHACGSEQVKEPIKTPILRAGLDLAALSSTLGLGLASFAALILGCVCLLAAATIGLLFKVTTLADWQAIQVWRIEWLLAAIALFAAGILLRRLSPKKP
ncbi:MAG TPA: hypothetical protein VKW06_09470 [Candidatus Angelobacter sp.]|nr:hypothetical protein [Candidatus Angelobacter sp.]